MKINPLTLFLAAAILGAAIAYVINRRIFWNSPLAAPTDPMIPTVDGGLPELPQPPIVPVDGVDYHTLPPIETLTPLDTGGAVVMAPAPIPLAPIAPTRAVLSGIIAQAAS